MLWASSSFGLFSFLHVHFRSGGTSEEQLVKRTQSGDIDDDISPSMLVIEASMACRHLLHDDECEVVSGIFPFPFASVLPRDDRDGILVDGGRDAGLLAGVAMPPFVGGGSPDDGDIDAKAGYSGDEVFVID
jgi:hypothetical protein